jgi:hypothetical protein
MIRPENQKILELNEFQKIKEISSDEERFVELCDKSIHPYKLMQMIEDLEKDVS